MELPIMVKFVADDAEAVKQLELPGPSYWQVPEHPPLFLSQLLTAVQSCPDDV